MTNATFKPNLTAIHRWFRAWSVPGLIGQVAVRVNPRLRVSLARAIPGKREIQIHPDLVSGSRALLREALCHEAAHLAADELHGPSIRPHGSEWAALMRTAGFEPRLRVESDTRPGAESRRASLFIYEHRCPVCQFVRFARRPVAAWRCRDCAEAGLDGRLLISSRRRSDT